MPSTPRSVPSPLSSLPSRRSNSAPLPRAWLACGLLALATVVGCEQPAPPSGASPSSHAPASSNAPASNDAASPLPSAERARVTTITTSLEVDDVGASVDRLRSLVGAHHGYVEEATTQLDAGGSAQLDLRVPAAELPAFRAALAHVGEITSEQESALDVTEKRADLDARERNARAEEQRLLDLLAQRTGDLSDVLAMEAQLSRVRESIERMQAQQRVLEQDIGYASVHLDIATHAVAFSDTPGQSIATAARKGFEFAWSMLVGITVLVVSVAPTALLWFAAIMLLVMGFRLVHRVRRRSTPAA